MIVLRKEHLAGKQAQHSTQMEALRSSTTTAGRELAVQRTRADALEQELSALRSLSVALGVALKSAKTIKKSRTTVSPAKRSPLLRAGESGGSKDQLILTSTVSLPNAGVVQDLAVKPFFEEMRRVEASPMPP